MWRGIGVEAKCQLNLLCTFFFNDEKNAACFNRHSEKVRWFRVCCTVSMLGKGMLRFGLGLYGNVDEDEV